jgi:hypothetical protein
VGRTFGICVLRSERTAWAYFASHIPYGQTRFFSIAPRLLSRLDDCFGTSGLGESAIVEPAAQVRMASRLSCVLHTKKRDSLPRREAAFIEPMGLLHCRRSNRQNSCSFTPAPTPISPAVLFCMPLATLHTTVYPHSIPIGPASAATPGAASFKSLYRKRANGFLYPHPLLALPIQP